MISKTGAEVIIRLRQPKGGPHLREPDIESNPALAGHRRCDLERPEAERSVAGLSYKAFPDSAGGAA